MGNLGLIIIDGQDLIFLRHHSIKMGLWLPTLKGKELIIGSDERNEAFKEWNKGCDCGNYPCTKLPKDQIEYSSKICAKYYCYECETTGCITKNQVKYMTSNGNKKCCYKCWKSEKYDRLPSHCENLMKESEVEVDMVFD